MTLDSIIFNRRWTRMDTDGHGWGLEINAGAEDVEVRGEEGKDET